MANQVEILNLDINTNQLIQRLADTKAQIESLQAAQRNLTATNQSSSAAFVTNDANLRRLQTSYAAQRNVVTALSAANNQNLTATQAVNNALNASVTTIAEATANNRDLIAVRNQLNTTTATGQAQLAQLNAQIDSNNALIRTNTSQLEAQRMGIGGYTAGIRDAFQGTNLFGGAVAGSSQTLGALNSVMNTARGQFTAGAAQIRNSATATQGMTASQSALTIATNIGTGAMRIFSAALAATGIGLIIIAVGLLVSYFKTFAPVVDVVEQGLAALGATVKVLQQAFVALLSGDFSKFKTLGSDIGEATSATIALTKAQQDLDDQMKEQEINNAKANAQYNQLILQSKNRTLSEGERLAALQKAQKIEEDNFNKNAALAAKQLANAQEEIRIAAKLTDVEFEQLKKRGLNYKEFVEKRTNDTDALFDKLGKAQLASIAITDETTKRQEKLQNQSDKLEEDRIAKAEKAREAEKAAAQKAAEEKQKLVDAALAQSKQEIDLFIAQQGFKKKSQEDELKFEQSLLNQRLALLKKEYDAKKISATAYETEQLKLKTDFAKKQSDILVANAGEELALYKKSIEQKKADDSFYTQQKLAAKQEENSQLAIKEQEFQLLRLTQGQLNEEQYLAAVALIKENQRIRDEDAQKLRDEAIKEQKAIDLENQIVIDEEKFKNDFDLELSREQTKYEAEKKAAEKNGADTTLIEQKHANAKKKINDALENAKMASAEATFGELASLLGEQTIAGKAAAIAQATMNTYQGVTAVWAAQSVLPEPIATIQKVISTAVVLGSGLSAVKKITSQKVPSRADGGAIPKLSSGVINNGSNLSVPLSNGDDTLAYVRQGEMILNAEQQRRAGGMQFFRSIGVPTFANGGFVSGNTNLNQNGIKMDMDSLAVKIGQEVGRANSQLPAPVTYIDDINSAQNNLNRIIEGANF